MAYLLSMVGESKRKDTYCLVHPLRRGCPWRRCVQNCPCQQTTIARQNYPGRMRSASLAKEKVLSFLIEMIKKPRVCVISTADFAGSVRPSPILIYFLSLHRQDHHAGSHSSQVLIVLSRQGRFSNCLSESDPAR